MVDCQGKLLEDWSRWDKTFKRPHEVLISPYDPEGRVWVDDDGRCAISVFSDDGPKLLQTIGTQNECGADDKHFNPAEGHRGLPWLASRCSLDTKTASPTPARPPVLLCHGRREPWGERQRTSGAKRGPNFILAYALKGSVDPRKSDS